MNFPQYCAAVTEVRSKSKAEGRGQFFLRAFVRMPALDPCERGAVVSPLMYFRGHR